MKVRFVESMGVYPHPMGISYAVFENEQTLITTESYRASKFNLEKCIQEITEAITFHRPKRIILRAFEPEARNSDRIRDMVKKIKHVAAEQRISVVNMKRKTVKIAFSSFGSKNKQDRAEKMVEWFPDYLYLLPRQRTFITSEDPKMQYFDAIALVVAHNLKNS